MSFLIVSCIVLERFTGQLSDMLHPHCDVFAHCVSIAFCCICFFIDTPTLKKTLLRYLELFFCYTVQFFHEHIENVHKQQLHGNVFTVSEPSLILLFTPVLFLL